MQSKGYLKLPPRPAATKAEAIAKAIAQIEAADKPGYVPTPMEDKMAQKILNLLAIKTFRDNTQAAFYPEWQLCGPMPKREADYSALERNWIGRFGHVRSD